MARHRGAVFYREKLFESRCSFLGYPIVELRIDGQSISQQLLKKEGQDHLGIYEYDKGAQILTDFFKIELEEFNTNTFDSLGQEIIKCFYKQGTLRDFNQILPMNIR